MNAWTRSSMVSLSCLAAAILSRTALKLLIYIGLIVSVSICSAYAQTIDPQQIAIIKETAASICNTVKDAKGVKTDVQIKGEIKAQLSGLVGRLVSAEGSGNGSLSKDEFEGLTQDATAIAMVGDRECRERLFNKIFDKLTANNQSLNGPDEVSAPKCDTAKVRLSCVVNQKSTFYSDGLWQNEKTRTYTEMYDIDKTANTWHVVGSTDAPRKIDAITDTEYVFFNWSQGGHYNNFRIDRNTLVLEADSKIPDVEGDAKAFKDKFSEEFKKDHTIHVTTTGTCKIIPCGKQQF